MGGTSTLGSTPAEGKENVFEHLEKGRQRNSALFLYGACTMVIAATAVSQFVPQFGVPERPGDIRPTLIRVVVVAFFCVYAVVAVPIRTYHRDIRVENGWINLPFMVSPIRLRGEGQVQLARVKRCAIEVGPTAAVQTLVIGLDDGEEFRFNAVRLRAKYRRSDGTTVVDWLVGVGSRAPR
jgi:hypothetical protein